MALRLRRDVQKASYYVWFLGAEEAKGLRGARIINSALPYLIDRARSQDPLKVTLQVSHKGIKILQGSSKHFIPHSAITSSVHTDDIVACVLLLYNPATKCPLHVHAYRCDSETTADALHQQLQILINRVENQKRFEELETRLGILPPIPTSDNKLPSHVYNEQKSKQQYPSKQQQQLRRQEASPKRLHSSLGSDTGNSTRESECSEERTGGSPMLPSSSNGKPATFAQQSNELFDSLAAELRAKLNGNGPPLLLPPRDYDTVHRSKGNLAAIELRRCRNSLIVGGATSAKPSHSMETATTTAKTVSKQVSSRGSSGIGSDLAPSPERQELNSSSDEEHWSNEADNSTIALKPSQISLERSMPIIQHQPQMSRRNVSQPPEDSYLRDLPSKPYREKMSASNEQLVRSKTPSSVASWSKEDEIKPIIVRPADYDAKFNRVLQTERKQDHHNRRDAEVSGKEHNKLRDTDKYDEINRLLNNKLSLERSSPEQRYKQKAAGTSNDFDDSDPSSSRDHIPGHDSLNYRKENLTDKQKCMEYSTKRQANSFAAKEVQRYGGRGLHRYVDPADLPFEQPQPPVATHSKYGVSHRDPHPSEEQLDIGHRTSERHREHKRETRGIDDPSRETERIREFDREHYSRDQPRNPYREPESIPYIQSMEKMMKSSVIRYKSFDGAAEPRSREEPKTKSKQRDNSYKCNNDDNDEIRDHEYNYQRSHGHEYPTASSIKNHSIDLKDKFRIQERVDSRYNLGDERECGDYKPRHRRSSIDAVDSIRVYKDWSDEEQCVESSPLPSGSRSRLRSKERHMFEERSREQNSRYESPISRDPRIPQRVSNRPRGTDVDHSRKMLREYAREHGHREYSPTPEHRACYAGGRAIEKHDESYMSQASSFTPASTGVGEPIPSGKSLSNHSKGYRHSYAEPVFARSGGRVGLAAVNPY